MMNLVPQSSEFNRAGQWRSLENEIAKKAKENNGHVDWEIMIRYDENHRPINYIVYYRVINAQGTVVDDNAVEFEDDPEPSHDELK
jgi:DNA/RNA endonuclease G (NUC1)